MLRILTGRAGDGKTETVLREICALADAGKEGSILLVPEQYSHEYERRLVRAGGNRISLFAEVLSFTRLSNRVFAAAGGLAEPYLDDGGRLLVMSGALEAVSSRLKVYSRPSRKAEFLNGLIATADELKAYGVSPEALERAAEAAGGNLGDKLRDLSLLYATYGAMTARGAADPRDRLTKLADCLEEYGFAEGRHIFIDGFTDFTPQEERVLSRLLEQAEEVTLTLVWDGLKNTTGEEEAVFAQSRRAAARLMAMAARRGIEARFVHPQGEKRERDAALRHLERHFFSDGAVFPEDAGSVSIFEANTAFSEAEYAAAKILELTRKSGYRYRDIAVCARSFGDYTGIVENVFEQYGVPVYLSEKSDILQKPVFTLILSALETIRSGYRHEELFRYLKTGLTDLTPEECDTLENYVLKWDLKGGQWTGASDWTLHPDGYGKPFGDKELERLQELNRIREKVRGPLRDLAQRSGDARTAGGQAEALYGFLEGIGLAERLKEKTEAFYAGGQKQLAEEYGQLWDILCGALDQCVSLLGDSPMEPEEFSRLLRLLLSQYQVGTIPVSLDRVAAGDITRMARRDVKCLILLGAGDGMLPLTTEAAGVLTDEDRKTLSRLGLTLAPTAGERLQRELFILYTALSLPSERLYISYPAESAGGEILRPSFAVGRLRVMLPGAGFLREREGDGSFRTGAAAPCLNYFAADPERRGALESLGDLPGIRDGIAAVCGAAAFTRGRLSPFAVSALYGRRVRMSASRADRFQSCRFAYFLQYGLKAEARSPAGFEAPEAGSFVHYVLQQVIEEAQRSGGFGGLSPERLRELSARAADRYTREVLGSLEDKDARFRYLYSRMHQTVDTVVENVAEELRESEFTPLGFEISFGEGGTLPPIELTQDGITLSISGAVDRADGWEGEDGKLYLRVVDYKTGRKALDYTEVFNGLGVQLFLYLFALERGGKELFGKEVVPAGAFYLPARDVILREEERDGEELSKKRDKALTRSGILLNDPNVLEAMERGAASGTTRFLPVRKGAPEGSLAGREGFVFLRRHVEKLMRDIAKELGRGAIQADPYTRGPRRCACDFCEYKEACWFDEGAGEDRKRYLRKISQEEFWTILGKEEEP
ncbi:PD-(D/E)XK nuclease family protein [Papillibacter cinnamivorans]|uniref:ATP-dependent helicase/nuclease subunit B n=1 Tax=Papillibacter cinnamivorans DSM 12816 TaxID=1122930 RepID=A0A1W1Z0F3_9FIRM|nr:PD-(D/E)XK nuclease family protein [Papillibacter cinnamivorans]SMC41863.1 ATP-dependent helicase/nuclease subunit B [Papillibacter cinnamivorans DSM 12816]